MTVIKEGARHEPYFETGGDISVLSRTPMRLENDDNSTSVWIIYEVDVGKLNAGQAGMFYVTATYSKGDKNDEEISIVLQMEGSEQQQSHGTNTTTISVVVVISGFLIGVGIVLVLVNRKKIMSLLQRRTTPPREDENASTRDAMLKAENNV